jgi:hypothetical protein
MVLNNTAAQVGCVISGNNGFEAKPNQKIWWCGTLIQCVLSLLDTGRWVHLFWGEA